MKSFYKIIKEISKESFLVIDSKIDKLYPKIKTQWDSDNIFFVDAKEENKSFESCNRLISFLIDKKIKKNNKIVAIGGGIIQDLTSFSASIIYRGIDWIFIPTTLLSQADSCIGSKTSINFNNTKNLLGSFHPPKEIYSFSFFLETLSDDDIKSGIGEMLHYFLIYNSKKTKKINDNYEKILLNRSLLEEFIVESLSIKKRMIEVDEFDKNERNIFNYGHTFGHAIESISNYSVSHGVAVTLGMDIANFISLKMSLIDRDRYDMLKKSLAKNMPDFKLPEDKICDYIELLRKDKKNIKKSITCVLMDSNKAKLLTIDDTELISSYINQYFKNTGKQNV
jgi:3-dehydroquinate synthase